MSFNANGLRSAARKGFFEWFLEQKIDILCIQETKAQEHQLNEPAFVHDGYHRFFFDAQKPGYSGVAIYTRQIPDRVSKGLGFPCADTEGRYIQTDFGNLSVASLYLPSGSSGDTRQSVKFEFMQHYLKILNEQLKSGREFIICGDWNMVHKPIDIKNFKANQNVSGCLPEERAWMDDLFNKIGFIDAFRAVNPHPEQYTWWSHFGQARAKNVGWRIDYQIVTPGLKPLIRQAESFKDPYFSDHGPVIVTYDDPV